MVDKILNLKALPESYCSITSGVFKDLPKKDIPFSLYRMSPSSGKFTPVTTPGKILVSAEKQQISQDCDRGLIFINCSDISENKEFIAQHISTILPDIHQSVDDHQLIEIITLGLTYSAKTVYEDSVKIHIEEFHNTMSTVSEVLHENPQLLKIIIPLLTREHSLVNKSISTGLIGAAVILLARESKPSLEVFNNALCALMLCDIGLCNLPEFVLGKEFCLTREEHKRIKQHPITSLELLKKSDSINKNSLLAILEHHERLDGSGYPRGVTGDKMSWLGKLCGAVDSYVAMTMQRPGKKRLTTKQALKNLYNESTKYDPNIVYAIEKVTYS